MATYNNSVVVKFDTKENGNAGAGASVTVYYAGTNTEADIIHDGSDPTANPLFADAEGNYSFEVNDGFYDIVINEGLLSEQKIENQQIATIISFDSATGHYESVQDAIASPIEVGEIITTAGYYNPNDGGAGQYIVVSGGTGTDDGGSYLDMSNGNQLELINNGGVYVEQFGASHGLASSSAINNAILYAASIGISTVNASGGNEPFLIDDTIVFQQGTKLIGNGYDRLVLADDEKGAYLKRVGAGFPMISINGANYGERLRNCEISRIGLDGNNTSDVILDINMVQNLTLDLFQIANANEKLVKIIDIYDSWFTRGYFSGGGVNGSIPAFEIDDSNGSNSSHNQNLTFLRVTFEGNDGTPLKAFGKGTGPGNTLAQFISCKFENLNTDDYQIHLSECTGYTFHDCLLVSRGLSGSINAQVYLEDCTNIRAVFDSTHNGGGATLASVIKTNTIRRSDLEIYTAATGLINNLTNSYIFDNADGTYDSNTRLRSSYMGSPVKDLAATNSLFDVTQPQHIDYTGATPIKLSRNGGTDSNVAIHFEGDVNGDVYQGKDVSGNFTVATSPDLSGTRLLSVDENGVQYFKPTQTTVGVAGGGSALPATPSGYIVVEIGVGEVVIPYYNKV